MNKLGLFVLLLASVSCINIQITDDETDQIYSAVVALFRGMAETEDATCAAALVKGKDKVLEIVLAAIDEVKAGTDVQTAISNAVIKLMAVDGLVSECNVLAMPAIITKVTSKDGLVEIFQNLIDNIDEVYDYGTQAKDAISDKDYDAAAEAAGHILSLALDFYVNL